MGWLNGFLAPPRRSIEIDYRKEAKIRDQEKVLAEAYINLDRAIDSAHRRLAQDVINQVNRTRQ